MILTVKKSTLKGTVAIPGSKSHTIRAVAIASLADGTSFIRNPLVSSDTMSAVACYRAFGADIDTDNPSVWKVTGTSGKVRAPDKPIDVGNSGTTLRIAAGTASLIEKGEVVITGDAQAVTRPMAPLLQALTELGAKAESLQGNGKAPVKVSGRLRGGQTSMECFTSQYLTSLLLAAPLATQDVDIAVPLLNEPDYVRMTLDWLDKQKIAYQNDDTRRFLVYGGQKYKAFDTAVPADFSSATFFLCAGACLDSDITLTGLDFTDYQPDKAVVDFLKAMGADISIDNDSSVHIKGSKLKGIEIDMNRTPDALPAMAVTAAFAEGDTKLTNVKHARSKETDRIACMAEELSKVGVITEEMDDGLTIQGGGLKAAKLDGRGDHRIVMALSLAGMAQDEPTTIDTAEAMNVTFPNYVELMQSLGADMEAG